MRLSSYLSLCFCSSIIWNYWIRNTDGCDPICSFTVCMWFCCLWASETLFLNLLIIFPMASVTTFSLLSLAVAIPFFKVRAVQEGNEGSQQRVRELCCGNEDGQGHWEQAEGKLKGSVSCGRRGWGVVSIPGRNEGGKVLFGKLVDETSAPLVLQGSRVPMCLWCRGCQTCCRGGLKKPVKLHRAIEDGEDRGPEVISFFSTTEIVFIVDVQAWNISLS